MTALTVEFLGRGMESFESETRSFIYVWITAIASLCYCYFVSVNLPAGRARLLSFIPVFALFAFLPLRLSPVLPTGVTGFFLTWLGNSKLLLLAYGSGPLLPKQQSLSTFLILACLPIAVRPRTEQAAKSRSSRLHLVKVFLLSVLVAIYRRKDDILWPKLLLMALYSSMVYLFIDVVLGRFTDVVSNLVEGELEPPSDEPYLSSSLQDFWGRRWNLAVTDTLRQSVYKPLRHAATPVLGVRWAPLPAVLAAFLVSGLMHELLFYYVTSAAPTWEVTWFFVFHGICVALEVGIKAALEGRWRLHPAVSGPMAVAFVVVTGGRWLFPPLVRSGADVRAVQETWAVAQLATLLLIKPLVQLLDVVLQVLGEPTTCVGLCPT